MCSTSTSGDLGLADQNHVCTCSTTPGAGAGDASSHGATSHGSDMAANAADPVVRAHYSIDGMTCSHCVSSVTEEVSALDGVDGVSVDLNVGGTSRIMVVSAQPIAEDKIRAAVTEAGYSLVASA